MFAKLETLQKPILYKAGGSGAFGTASAVPGFSCKNGGQYKHTFSLLESTTLS